MTVYATLEHMEYDTYEDGEIWSASVYEAGSDRILLVVPPRTTQQDEPRRTHFSSQKETKDYVTSLFRGKNVQWVPRISSVVAPYHYPDSHHQTKRTRYLCPFEPCSQQGMTLRTVNPGGYGGVWGQLHHHQMTCPSCHRTFFRSWQETSFGVITTWSVQRTEGERFEDCAAPSLEYKNPYGLEEILLVEPREKQMQAQEKKDGK